MSQPERVRPDSHGIQLEEQIPRTGERDEISFPWAFQLCQKLGVDGNFSTENQPWTCPYFRLDLLQKPFQLPTIRIEPLLVPLMGSISTGTKTRFPKSMRFKNSLPFIVLGIK